MNSRNADSISRNVQSAVAGLLIAFPQIQFVVAQYGYKAVKPIEFALFGAVAIISAANIVRAVRAGKVRSLAVTGVWFAAVAAWYAATSVLVGFPKAAVKEVIEFALMPVLFMQSARLDTRKTILAVMAASALTIILSPSTYFGASWKYDHNWWFLLTNCCTPAIIATLAYVRFYLKSDFLRPGPGPASGILDVIMNAALLPGLLLHGSRGGLLCILIFLLFIFVIRVDDGGAVRFRKIRLACVLALAALCTIFLKPILLATDSALQAAGLGIDAVSRCVEKMEMGDIGVGRSEIWGAAWAGFLQRPLVGNGLDSMNIRLGYLHPDNFLLQILYDGGILMLLLIAVPVILGLRVQKKAADSSARDASYDRYVMVALLFFMSVPRNLLLFDLWSDSLHLWMFFGFSISLGCAPPAEGRPGKGGKASLISASAVAAAACAAVVAFLLPKHPERLEPDPGEPLCIFCIGANARADHFQLYGYGRETTPRLAAASNTIIFSRVHADSCGKKLPIDNILGNGFGGVTAGQSAYITTRALSPKAMKIYGKADYRDAYVHFQSPARMDGRMLPRIKEAYASGCRTVIAAGCGSQLRYALHCPESEIHFAPSLGFWRNQLKWSGEFILNAYDNTIRYTDKCLGELIDWAESLDVPCILTYVSDSGGKERHVPLVVWYSDRYAENYGDRVSRLESVKDSLLTTSALAGIADMMK